MQRSARLPTCNTLPRLAQNCEESTRWYEASGRSPRWLRRYLHEHWHDAHAIQALDSMGGGFDWTCGTFAALPKYFARLDVRRALHLPEVSQTSTFAYDSSGPASITLYPRLIKYLRILIYNGDADACGASAAPRIGRIARTSAQPVRAPCAARPSDGLARVLQDLICARRIPIPQSRMWVTKNGQRVSQRGESLRSSSHGTRGTRMQAAPRPPATPHATNPPIRQTRPPLSSLPPFGWPATRCHTTGQPLASR